MGSCASTGKEMIQLPQGAAEQVAVARTTATNHPVGGKAETTDTHSPHTFVAPFLLFAAIPRVPSYFTILNVQSSPCVAIWNSPFSLLFFLQQPRMNSKPTTQRHPQSASRNLRRTRPAKVNQLRHLDTGRMLFQPESGPTQTKLAKNCRLSAAVPRKTVRPASPTSYLHAKLGVEMGRRAANQKVVPTTGIAWMGATFTTQVHPLWSPAKTNVVFWFF